jgi:hypothetical protein
MKSAIKFLFFPAFLFLIFGFAHEVHAATLGISPRAGTYSVGQTIAVSVLVTSTDQAINAVSGQMKFPTDKLQAISISKAGSLLQIWSVEPTYSNSQGTVHYEGVVPNPGFQGASGKIVTLYFKVAAEGTASITFTDGMVLANDGNGTDILNSSGDAQFTLVAAAREPKQEEPTPGEPKAEPAPPISTISPESTTTPATISNTESKKAKLAWYNNLSQYSININIVSLSLFIIVLLFILLLIELYGLFALRRLYKRLRRRVAALDQNIHQAFHLLYDDVKEHFDELHEIEGDRKLTGEERRFMEHIKDSLGDTEKFLVGKHSDMGKKLR